MEKLKKIIRAFFDINFLKFIITGGINTLNTTIISYFLSFIFPPTISFVAGYLVSLIIAYFINCAFIFYEKESLSGLLKFGISYIPNFIIQTTIVYVLSNKLNVREIYSYLLAAVFGIPLTFLIVKVFAFRRNL